jgi:hypothetical protein
MSLAMASVALRWTNFSGGSLLGDRDWRRRANPSSGERSRSFVVNERGEVSRLHRSRLRRPTATT